MEESAGLGLNFAVRILTEGLLGLSGRKEGEFLSWNFVIIMRVVFCTSVLSTEGKRFSLILPERRGSVGGWKILASKLRNIGVVPAHSPLKLPQGDVYHRRERAAHFPRKGASFANAIFRGKG